MSEGSPLVTQISALPTRKLSAVAVTAAIGVIVAALLGRYVPGFGSVLDSEVVGVPVDAAIIIVVSWFAGYLVKDVDNTPE